MNNKSKIKHLAYDMSMCINYTYYSIAVSNNNFASRHRKINTMHLMAEAIHIRPEHDKNIKIGNISEADFIHSYDCIAYNCSGFL
jgi:hypothetical protein